MSRAEPVLICALSGRALAQAARAAGFAPIVLDAFADLDTRAAATASARIPVDGRWRLRGAALLAAARRLAPAPMPLVWGSGFERQPRLLERLGAGREVWGNGPATVRATKDPLAFAAAAARLGIGHPQVRADPPREPSGWLCKRAGGAGGGHVGRARAVAPRGRGWYWQRRMAGVPVSALVVGTVADARVLAIGRQLTAPAAGRRFRFGGTLAPAAISAAAHAALERAALALARNYRLQGLASIDALVVGDRVAVLEINPRPGGSFDAYAAALGMNLFAIHVAACRDAALPEAPVLSTPAASLIVYAQRATRIPEGFDWPSWASDRSPGGSAIASGGPICTVLAHGQDPRALLELLQSRVDAIRHQLAPSSSARRHSHDGKAMILAQAACT